MLFLSTSEPLRENNEPTEYGTFIRPDDLYDDGSGGNIDSERHREAEKALLRKLDLRCACLLLLFVMNIMDRTSTAAARLKGLEEDLHMSGTQFNTLIGTLYIGYALMQTPSNWFLSRYATPSMYLSGGVALWGTISIAMGTAQSYYSAIVLRFLLGFAEATFLPGAIFLLSRWYTRSELGLRIAILTCGVPIGHAFGSLIASGILSVMDGTLGIPGWRWLFFVEGTLTVIMSALAIFIIPDFPSSPAGWLTSEEHRIAQARTGEVPHGPEQYLLREAKDSGLWDAVTDAKVWSLAIAQAGIVCALSFGNFFPTLCATMGYSPTITLLLCAPPWLTGAATSFWVTRHSDSSGERFWHLILPLSTSAIGFTIALSTMNTTMRYISFFFMTQVHTAYVILLAWLSNSISEAPKRAVGIAFINTIAMCGNAGASLIWPSYWGPTYSKSFSICVATSLLSVAICSGYRLYLAQLNKEAETLERISGLPTGFRYLL